LVARLAPPAKKQASRSAALALAFIVLAAGAFSAQAVRQGSRDLEQAPRAHGAPSQHRQTVIPPWRAQRQPQHVQHIIDYHNDGAQQAAQWQPTPPHERRQRRVFGLMGWRMEAVAKQRLAARLRRQQRISSGWQPDGAGGQDGAPAFDDPTY